MIIYTKFKIKNYIAITIYPFIIINHNYKGDETLINHEKIHIEQQRELLWIGFFVLYMLEFIFRFFQYQNWKEAYLSISFEKEANFNENNILYLSFRKNYSFIKYYKTVF